MTGDALADRGNSIQTCKFFLASSTSLRATQEYSLFFLQEFLACHHLEPFQVRIWWPPNSTEQTFFFHTDLRFLSFENQRKSL